MLTSPGLMLQRARLFGTKFFYRFGIHCATHQIRLILVSSVVITSLLFPAIAIYYSSQTQYFAGFTLRVLDSFLTPNDISSYFAQHDLRHLWEGDNMLRRWIVLEMTATSSGCMCWRMQPGISGELVVLAQTPKLIALEYERNHSKQSRLSVLSAFSYGAYLAFSIYCFRSFRRMDVVHSRLGLAFTGLVEILVSTITSVSVCALVGFRVTMVPWELFPIIVVFIGVENMLSIVDAVVKTSITLTVKERVAQGLSRAGTSNTLKVVSYNTVLGIIAFFSTGAIRQFCAFSIVVLVAHWFLVHTFFVTVVSIDIQRLELDELLQQNASLAPAIPGARKSTAPTPETKFGKAMFSMQNVLRGRAPKNISLFLLLAITATLYYATYPHSARSKEDIRIPLPRNPLAQLHKASVNDRESPAFRIWQILNPLDDPLVHVRVESPTILVLSDADDATVGQQPATISDKAHRPRWSRWWGRTLRRVGWLLKIVVAPMTATTMLLYGLLLYLLKDAELLEAQRHCSEPESPSAEEPPSIEGKISFTTLPRAFATDVDLIASSKDGRTIATVGVQNELVIWRTEGRSYVATVVDASGVLLGSASTPSAATTLTAIAINDRGTMCAAGTGSGIIAAWSIGKDQVKPLPHLSSENATSSVTALHFGFPVISSSESTPTVTATSSPLSLDPHTPDTVCCLYATYNNGMAMEWNVDSFANPRYITPSRSASVVRSMLLPVQAEERLLVGFSLEDGTVELCDVDSRHSLLPDGCWIAAGNPTDMVTRIHVCNIELDGTRYLIIGAATQAGVISIWEGQTGQCLHILDEVYGDISSLRISPVHTTICSVCGELPIENFSITFSVGHVVLFYRAYLTLPSRRCSCPRNLPRQAPRSSLLGHRSRSGSCGSLASSTGTTTPVRSRSRISSISGTSSNLNTPMFPVSAHGVHSRRVSEKDILRRNLETFFINSDCVEYDAHPIGPQDVTPASSFLASYPQPSIWQSLVVVKIADATIERGSWDVGQDKIVGIRRRPRPPFIKENNDSKVHARIESSQGLSASTLERWELWTFDPSECRLQASPLAALSRDDRNSDPVQRNSISLRRKYETDPVSPRITATLRRRQGVIPRLHFTRVSPFVSQAAFCLAGFGNTVGLFNSTQIWALVSALLISSWRRREDGGRF
ncbi:Sterol regulatory element-binding protein cleavage-activating protein [Grifola frondosa]|uniref:Sterol regulatory element-binding protein cleavage-activating protein n=1 Tax=Grifola frondosa TaxID=5627 RepID=A0A1C7MFE9_GRIFR|nr:Sterol regulatory element-binding protein cleavage-activating protein [Grifola frondosa]